MGVADKVISNAVDESGVMTKTMLVFTCHCLTKYLAKTLHVNLATQKMTL